ncbi:MAG: transposase [Proteobacteria bacterium]|nr:transposase [Pseudomonadota bacterium]
MQPPNNNLAENPTRPFCVGRKNWLFAGNPKGAQASAVIYLYRLKQISLNLTSTFGISLRDYPLPKPKRITGSYYRATSLRQSLKPSQGSVWSSFDV